MKVISNLFSWILRHKRITGAIFFAALLAYILYPKPLPPLATQKVTKGTLVQSLSVSGNAIAKTKVNLSFQTSGKVVYVGAKKGDSVTAGQTIAMLDQRTVQKNLEQALLTYSVQRNTFENTRDQYGDTQPQDANTTALQRILWNNQYNLDQAVKSVELQDLVKQQMILSAPFSGILTRADIESPGPIGSATTIYTVTDPASVVFDMDVDQADIGKVQLGQTVHIVFDAYPDKTIDETVTKIDFVSHATSNGGNAFTVETSLPANAGNTYRDGMNANAEIILTERVDVLTVPLSAITDNSYVYVKKGNYFEKRKVTLGLQSDTDAQVVAGLESGEEVALDPTQASQRLAPKTFFHNSQNK